MRPSPPEGSSVGYRCELCGQAFRTPGELARHRTVEHLDRPFPARCAACGRSFDSPSDLKAHNQSAHGAPAD
jgi:DNA-directed RNA polymerase subunit RPC12/RpoP